MENQENKKYYHTKDNQEKVKIQPKNYQQNKKEISSNYIPTKEKETAPVPNGKNENDNSQSKKINKPYTPNQKVNKQVYRRDTKNDLLLSIIIPVLNEEESLPELSLQLENELEKVSKGRYEVIIIDDGSTDNTFAVIKQINERNRRFKGIRFRRNYGKSAALSVGFSEAKGLIVITMDGDLQDDPAEIPNLIAKLKEGFDMVSGWKKKRYDPITKTIPSKFFNFVTSRVSRLKLHDFNCGLKAYRKEVVKSIQMYGEMHRYIPALANWDGFKVTEIPVQHHPRRYGKTKFGFSRFFKGFLDLLTVYFTTRFMKRPLHFFGTVGIILTVAGIAIDAYLLVEWFMGLTALSNRPLALLGIALIIVGVQSVSIGLLGEMITKNSLENARYSIKERIY